MKRQSSIERVKLSKDEKIVLRLLAGECGCPDTYPRHVFVSCVERLDLRNPVDWKWIASITVGLIAAVAAIAALFVACGRMN